RLVLQVQKKKLESESSEIHGGRLRRKALFRDEFEDGEDEFAGGYQIDDNTSKWKQGLKKDIRKKKLNLEQIVYGASATSLINEDHESSDDDDEDFFKPKGEESKKLGSGLDVCNANSEYSSKFVGSGILKNWKEKQVCESIRDRFTTGDWSKAGLRNQNDELYGDFEDLETGENHSSHHNTEPGAEEVERGLKKLALRAKFDEETNNDDNGNNPRNSQAKEPAGYFEKLKEELEIRKQMNLLALNELDEDTRIEVEGFRTGTYLRLEIHNVPYEMVEFFDPCHPVLVGGIGFGEDNAGYMQARLKKHRWHKKVLKTRDPLVVSIGWRRYQTLPVYATEDPNGKQRMLKYTPQHMHCLAMLWGPLVPPKTGFVAFQNLSNNQVQEGGIARCTFEDQIKMSDIVFLKAWTKVEVPQFYNPLTTALQPRDKTWQGMKTLGQLRREQNIPVPLNKDSLYKPIERKCKKFNPLVVPRSLQAALPFESKPKDIPVRKRPSLEAKRAVVMEPKERKALAILQHFRLMNKDKMKKRKVKEQLKKMLYEAEKTKNEEMSKKRKREEIHERYRTENQQKKKMRRSRD
ncbi:hypothetical protein EUTSA_v10027216mg, partial [Eutrema salsugineum]